jgi:hypothetical protein
MIHVLTRLDKDDRLFVMKVAEADGAFALVEGAKYLSLGAISKRTSIRDGFSVQEWVGVSDGDIYQVRAGTRKKAVELLLARYGMVAIRDVDTIPALF